MNWTEPVFIIYTVFYAVAFVLAFIRRKTFPFGEVIAVILIVGFGFTAVVHFITLQAATLPLEYENQPSEVVFILAYLVFITLMLALGIWKQLPAGWKENFLKNKLGVLAYKLVLFVIIPALALSVLWKISLPALGFSMVELPRQIWVAALLVLLLGGFNLIAGKAAAPIRSKEFTGLQLLLGFLITFIWNIFEVGLVEEFFFRAFLQARLTNFFGSPLSGICAASLLFGLAHAPGIYLRGAGKDDPLGTKPTLIETILYSFLVLSATGWFMGLLFWRTQSLLAPILVHAGLDTVAHMSEFIKNIDWLKQFGK